jgi:multicomponent Na+:H+ antiporter subunit B
MQRFGLVMILLFGVVLVYAGLGLPQFGDPEAPAATHVSDHYIEHAYHDAHTPNIVTVMIADYRSYDTLGETIVVFAAGLACLLLLRGGREERRRGSGAKEPS